MAGLHARAPFRHARICACGDHGFVGLTRGRVALADAADVPQLSLYTWRAKGGGSHVYAVAGSKPMHRLLTRAKAPHVDHKNHDTLDNRRANLRPCTPAQNVQNQRDRSGRDLPKGIIPSPNGQKFVASISADGTQHHLGTFTTVEAAAAARREAEDRLHGEFAYRPEGAA